MGARWLTDIAKGEWWLPATPERRVPGVLAERNGRYRLELIGTLDGGDFDDNVTRYDVVCGFLTQGGPVTLTSCVGSKSFSMPGMIAESCNFRIALKGHNFDTLGNSFLSVSGRCPAVLAWMNRSGLEIKLTSQHGDLGAPTLEWSAVYRVPEPLIFDWNENVKFVVSIGVSGLPTGAIASKPILIEQICFVEAKGATPTTISLLHQALHEFELLVRLLSGFPRSLQVTSCRSPHATTEEGKVKALDFQFDSLLGDDVDVTSLNYRDALVPYPDVQGRFPSLVVQWGKIVETQGEVLHSYFAGRHAKHMEDRLMTCANALQRLDESTEGRRSFKEAVSQPINQYLPAELAAQSIALLVRTRHFHTL